MISPTIHLHDVRWKKALHPYCKRVEGVVLTVILSEPRAKSRGKSKDRSPLAKDPSTTLGISALSIVLTNDAEIQTLNKKYRGKNKPTNVLSFPNDEEPLGDVILAFETIAREALEQGKDFKDHATHLIIHGILHLMGYNHEVSDEAEMMEAKEIKILKRMGIANPYSMETSDD